MRGSATRPIPDIASLIRAALAARPNKTGRRMTPAAVLAAADDADATKKNAQVCEANFFAGELSLRQGAGDEAGRSFRLAVNDCPKAFTEWWAGKAQLKGLGSAL